MNERATGTTPTESATPESRHSVAQNSRAWVADRDRARGRGGGAGDGSDRAGVALSEWATGTTPTDSAMSHSPHPVALKSRGRLRTTIVFAVAATIGRVRA
ncbi:hypothetical protein [Nocardia sp. CA-135398]|uniref:hypothetical protein n=1 Tax=Nocardia sp. CA-135398 TaxID=3239977 RepID=UPI003D95ED61